MGRPQRSARSSNYNEAAAFASFALDSSSSRSGSDQEKGAAARPRKKRKLTPSEQEESSGPESAYEDAQGKDGPADEQSEDNLSGVEEEAASDQLSAGKEPTPDSDDVDLSMPMTEIRAVLPNGSKKAPARTKVTASNLMPTKGNMLSRGGFKKSQAGSRFVEFTADAPLAGLIRLPIWARPFTPLHSTETVFLTHAFDDEIHSTPAKNEQTDSLQGCRILPACEEHQRDRIYRYWADMMFTPAWQMMEDFGFCKGKAGHLDKWGGWYEQSEWNGKYTEVSADTAKEHLPLQIYTNEKQNLKLPPIVIDPEDELFGAKQAPGEPEQANGTNGSEMQIDEPAIDPETSTNNGPITVLIGPADSCKKDATSDETALTIERFKSESLAKHNSGRLGFLLNAGAPVWCLDWCPLADLTSPTDKEYLAVGTVSDSIDFGATVSKPRKGLVQIWSIDCTNRGMFSRNGPASVDTSDLLQLEMALCIDEGEPWRLQWCPRGGNCEEKGSQSLGLLAVVCTDGCLRIYDVPRPDGSFARGAFLQIPPRLLLELPDTKIMCFDWSSHERIVAGCENGHIAAWNIGTVLRTGQTTTMPPIIYQPAHASAVTTISVLQVPPSNGDGEFSFDQEPQQVMSGGIDGIHRITDFRDPGYGIARTVERYAARGSAFSPHLGTCVTSESSNGIYASSVTARAYRAHPGLNFHSHNGEITAVSASNFHTFLASAAFDGTVAISNPPRRARKRHHVILYSNTVFSIDYHRKDGMYRMLDGIVPTNAALHSNKSKANIFSGAHPPEIAVTSVAWCRNLRHAGFLASGTASGLVRLDWISDSPTDSICSIDASLNHADNDVKSDSE